MGLAPRVIRSAEYVTKDELENARVEKAKEELSRQVVRLQDELDAMIKMTAHQRRSLEDEMLRLYQGHKEEYSDPKILAKLNALVKTADLLVSAKIRLDKSLKQLADVMTPEEELAAVKTYIKSLEPKVRVNLLMGLLEWHRKKTEAAMAEAGVPVVKDDPAVS